MEITKLGHCCLVIKVGELTILTDPGMFTDAQNSLTNIDLVLITHEHADHFHIESLKQILKNNPNLKVMTNTAVGKLLEKENIAHEIVEDGQNQLVKDVLIEGFGTTHAEVYKSITPVQNTGYLIAGRFFMPGDALHVPAKQVEILALPVAGPWIKISEAIDYAKAVKPKKCFPVHDAIIAKEARGFFSNLPANELAKEGIELHMIEDGKSVTF